MTHTSTSPKRSTEVISGQNALQNTDRASFWEEPTLQAMFRGRDKEINEVVQALICDKDLLIIGAPGNGRQAVVKEAARQIKAEVLNIDCMKATSSEQLLQLLLHSLNCESFRNSEAQKLIEKMGKDMGTELIKIHHHKVDGIQLRISSNIKIKDEQDMQKRVFKVLIQLFQDLAESLKTRILVIFQSFEHIHTWDRQRERITNKKLDINHTWEDILRKEIAAQSRVSYVLIGTGISKRYQKNIKNKGKQENLNEENLDIVTLRPLNDDVLKKHIRDFVLHHSDLNFNSKDGGLEEFFNAVRGHFSNAIALAQRLILICKVDQQFKKENHDEIYKKQVLQAIKSLLKDMHPFFEALLLSLPDGQLQVLECLALDPTTNPHKQEYIDKHSLMKGGTLQGALKGLIEKGLIYEDQKDQHDYQLTLPLMALWIRRRLT